MRKLFFLILIINVSCKKENINITIDKKNINQISIDLVPYKKNTPFASHIRPFSDIDSLPKDFKGIPNYSYKTLLSYKFVSKKNYTQAITKGKIDSINAKVLNSKIYAISAIEGNKQIMILDENQNHDFSDDQKYIYDANLRSKTRQNKELRDTFPLVKLKYKEYFNNKIRDRENFVTLMPYKDYFSFVRTPTKAELQYVDLILVTVHNYYREGFFEIDSSFFKIAVNEDNDRFILQRKEKPYRKTSNQEYEEYKQGDTIKVAKKSYIKIDSLGGDLNKVYLTKLDINSLPNPYKQGETIKDYKFTTMDGTTQNISDLLKNKDYVLMDFWGTWCAPCLALTPDLKKFHTENPDVAMLGVDFDFEKLPGLDYIKEKELEDWTHTYIERVRYDSLLQNKLVGKLRINRYPTFILLDKNLNIIYRGRGKKGLGFVKEQLALLKREKRAEKAKN